MTKRKQLAIAGIFASLFIAGAPLLADTASKIRRELFEVAEPIAGGTSAVTVKAPALSASYNLTLPTTDGNANETLIGDGAGTLSWAKIADANVDSSAAIARSKIANGTADHVVINNGSGTLSSEAALSPARGGTGVSNNSAATLTRSGNHALTLTTTNTTSLTLPTTGTVATLAGAENLSSKTLASPTVTGTLLLQNPSGSQPELALSEDPDNGTDAVTVKAPASFAAYTLTLPTDDGSNGQVLQTDGNGVLSWTGVASTNDPTFTGTVTLQNPSGSQPILALSEDPDNGTNVVNIQAPATLGSDYTLTLPTTDGNADEVAITDGAGVLSFGKVANANVAADAAIAYSKLNLSSSITSSDITDGTIVNADVNASAAIAYSKLNLATSIVNADISGSAAIDGTKIVSAASGVAGVVSTGSQTFTGAKTFDGDILFNKFERILPVSYNVAADTALTSGDLTTSAVSSSLLSLATANGAFTIDGAAARSDGSILIIYNGSGQTATVNHESGTEGTGGNRFRIPGGSNYSLGNNLYAIFIYLGRWTMLKP